MTRSKKKYERIKQTLQKVNAVLIYAYKPKTKVGRVRLEKILQEA